MPEVRRRSATDAIGAAIARTSTGVSQGGGIAVELARVAATPDRSASAASRSAVFNGEPSGPHANGSTVEFSVPSGSWYLTLRVSWDGTVTGGPTPQTLFAEVIPDPGPFQDARTAIQMIGPGAVSLIYTLADVSLPLDTYGVQCTLAAPDAVSLDAEFTLTVRGIRAA